jgi:hypothetical protein
VIDIYRRQLIFCAAFSVLPWTATGQVLKPFKLRLSRIGGLPSALSLNSCLPGQLFLVDQFSVADPGSKVADTLELPYRNNLNQVSAIPSGTYAGRVRSDGNIGWRIEFDAVPNRSNIQIHPGNVTSQIEGCILVGSAANASACSVTDSRAARDKIMALYGANNSRPIEVRVEE